jgi:hypothetical protein
LKHFIIRLTFILLAGWSIIAVPYQCSAQAVPDTSINNIIRDDSVRQRQQPAPRAQFGQGQSVQKADTAIKKPGPFLPNPKKAGLYSAIVPGLGQLYNRQYWKIPVVYVGIAVAGYFFIDNLNNYQSYRKAYIGRINNPYPTDKYAVPKLIYSTEQLQQLQNDYNKYLDMTVLLAPLVMRSR